MGLKVASVAMGALRPIFQVQASVQAGKYDKWAVRKEIEEEIKKVPHSGLCHRYHRCISNIHITCHMYIVDVYHMYLISISYVYQSYV